jgi:Uma2 family endonuclease
MAAVVVQQEEQSVRIPGWVCDLASFRRWAKSDEFPDRGWYAHLNGELWVDPSMERLAHNQVKTQLAVVLTPLVEELGIGRFLGDRMLLTHVEADLSTEPDGMFLSYEGLRDGRVQLAEGEDSLEVEGSPDVVVEVVSPTSRQKDTVVLRGLYWRAGVREYWLADPRRQELAFDILKYGPKGYVAARKQGGWIKSTVFGKSFRLTRGTDPVGLATYTLDVR